MMNPSQKYMVNENRSHEAWVNRDQEANGKYEENAQKKDNEILKELNCVDTKEIEYPLHTQGNPHFTHDCCE